jgi:hypothetical protein
VGACHTATLLVDDHKLIVAGICMVMVGCILGKGSRGWTLLAPIGCGMMCMYRLYSVMRKDDKAADRQ